VSAIKINGVYIGPGEIAEVKLNEYRLPTRAAMQVPVHVFRSHEPGPVLLLMAGVHGDEINGIEIIRKLLRGNYFRRLRRGSVIVIPIVNIVSFLNGSRELPDGRDLNRCFPGSQSGSLGSRIAYDMMNEILPQVDFGVDFHTGGAKINNYPQVRCVFNDHQNLDLAKLFGAPFVVDSTYRDKTFRMEAARHGKSILVYEAGESLRFNKLAISEGITGCLRLLNGLGMLDEDVPAQKTIMLRDTKWIRARVSGLFRTTKKYGSFIEKDTVIGTISDPYGDMEMELHAPDNGFIIGINNQPVINEGDALIHIGLEG
jgi:predicted deacylase